MLSCPLLFSCQPAVSSSSSKSEIDKVSGREYTETTTDEESHHSDFQHFIDKAQKEGGKDVRGSRMDKVVQPLNWGIEHEYTVILQYMFQSYMTTNADAKKQL
ncbi:hypothetical protein ACFLVX_00860 [Chloroflexota bacterium]